MRIFARRYHEAGYDAYVTGKCFLSLLQRLGRHAGGGGAARVLPSSPLLQVLPSFSFSSSSHLLLPPPSSSPSHLILLPLIQPFLNKLFLMRIPDTPYLDLAGPDPPIAREHVFHLTFPKVRPHLIPHLNSSYLNTPHHVFHLTFPKEWKTADLINLFQERFGGVQVGGCPCTCSFICTCSCTCACTCTCTCTQA